MTDDLPLRVATPSLGVRLWVEEDGDIQVNFANEGGRGAPSRVLFLPVVRAGRSYEFAGDFLQQYRKLGRHFWSGKSWRRSLSDKGFSPKTVRFDAAGWPSSPERLVIVLLTYWQHAALGECEVSNLLKKKGLRIFDVTDDDLPDLYYAQECELLQKYLASASARQLARSIVPSPGGARHNARQPQPPAPRQRITFAAASCNYPAGLMDATPPDLSAATGPADASWLRLARRIKTPASVLTPSLLILTGDQVYVDATAGMFDPKVLDDRYQNPYKKLFASRGAQAVFNRLPSAMMLDDHEIENNWEPPACAQACDDGVAAYRLWQRGQNINGVPPKVFPESPFPNDPQVQWCRFEHRGIPVFMADTRTRRERRTVGTLGSASIIDTPQRDALHAWLAAGTAAPKLVVSPSIVLPRRQRTARSAGAGALHSDAWDGYPASLNALLAHVCDNGTGPLVFVSGDEHLSCVAEVVVTNLRTKKSVRLHSVHSSALYAPYPFANSLPEHFAGNEYFEFTCGADHYGCKVGTWFPREGDGYALLSLSQDARAGWQLDVWFDKGLANVHADHRHYALG